MIGLEALMRWISSVPQKKCLKQLDILWMVQNRPLTFHLNVKTRTKQKNDWAVLQCHYPHHVIVEYYMYSFRVRHVLAQVIQCRICNKTKELGTSSSSWMPSVAKILIFTSIGETSNALIQMELVRKKMNINLVFSLLCVNRWTKQMRKIEIEQQSLFGLIFCMLSIRM